MRIGWQRLRPYLLLIALGPILYLPVSLHASTFYSDYGAHIEIALALPEKVKHVSHVLFSALFLLIHRLLPSLTLPHAQVAAVLIFMLPVPLIAFSVLKQATKGALPDSLLMLLSLSLTVLAPVTIWTSPSMVGYLNPIVYHNPTAIAVRLFLIPVSFLALGIYDYQPDVSLNRRIYVTLLNAVFVLLATLAKPSYTLALIPGCCLLAMLRLLMRRRVDFRFLIFGICLPGAIMLSLLYLLTYFNYDDGSTIAFGFLTFMKSRVPLWRVFIQLALSLVFPIGVYLSYHREARRDLYLNMSWLIFGVGAAYAYLLYEEGTRFLHGNFLWSGYSAVFVLMFASALFFVKLIRPSINSEDRGSFPLVDMKFTRREAFLILLFGLHLFSGIAYYLRFLATAPR